MIRSVTRVSRRHYESEADAFFAETRHWPLAGALVSLLGVINVISALAMLAGQG